MKRRERMNCFLSTLLVLTMLFSSQTPTVFAQGPVSEATVRIEESINEQSETDLQKADVSTDMLLEENVQEETEQADKIEVSVDSEGYALESEADIESKDFTEVEETAEDAVLETADALPGNPRIATDSSMTSGRKVTWDCVWFGSYPQREVVKQANDCGTYGRTYASSDDYIVDATLYSSLQNATWNSNGEATIGGVKYRRVQKNDATHYTSSTSSTNGYFNWSSSTTYRYFRYDPIKWRVLNVSGEKALLLADKALDDQKYNMNYTGVTWATSSMRSWLNGYNVSSNEPQEDYTSKNFIGSAFTSMEKSAILASDLENKKNLYFDTEGGNDTEDRVFLLSEEEVYVNNGDESFESEMAITHGFAASYDTYDEARRCKSSTYAKAMGVWSNTDASYLGNCGWWLRSPGSDTDGAAYVGDYGSVYFGGNIVSNYDSAARPALNLNLSSTSWSNAGTVCSDGTQTDPTSPPVVKKNQTITGGISSKKIKAKSVKKKAQKFKIGATASTPVSYKLAGYADKKTKKAKKYFKVASNGTVTVKKGCKKGTYKLKITMSAAGDAYYNAAPSVTRKITIKVK